MKRVFAMLLALMLVLSLATPALAAEPDTTTLAVNATNRTFDAYQIMIVTHDGTDAYNYAVVEAFRPALVAALNLTATDDKSITDAISALTTGEAVRHFADALYREIQDTSITPDLDNWNGANQTVAQGYWLIVDVTENLPATQSHSLVILDTAGDDTLSVNLKDDTTTSQKKVDDENDSISDDIAGNEDARNWQDVADYDIGDKVPFVITGQLANDVTSYNYYSFRIVDTVDIGLTHLGNVDEDDSGTIEDDEINIQFLLNGQLQELGPVGSDAEWIYAINGQTLTVYPNYGYTTNEGDSVAHSATAGGDILKVFPEGTPHAEINSSTFTLRYNCLLNENAVIGGVGNKNDAKVVVSNNPYGDGFGETPLDTTITFTYQFVVNKVDPKGNPLTGAEFSLYKFMSEGKGSYTGPETDVATTAKEAAKKDMYFNHPAANSYGKFEEVDRLIVNTEGTEFTFKGIDDGYYVLIETEVPDGYKEIEPVEFHVISEHVTGLTSNPANKIISLRAVVKGGTNQTISGDTATGTLTAVIENHTGAELPSTGGMGTTVFYVLGSILVMGALVMLITKKRMSVN